MPKLLLFALLTLEFAAAQSPAAEVTALANPAQAPALAQQWVRQSRERVDAVGALLLTGEPADQRKARGVLNDLDELVLPWLTEAPGLRPADEAWRLRTLAEETNQWRRRAAQAIDRQLANREPIPRDPRARSEEPEPLRRVCDEAYRAMLELLQGSEAAGREMRLHWQLPEGRRDAAIRSLRQRPAWRALLR
jgi:hypothetical protein